MEFSNSTGTLRNALCREAIFGTPQAAAAATLALPAFPPPSRGRLLAPRHRLLPLYRSALEAGLDPPKARNCRFARMSDAPAWTKGPLEALHSLLKSRYRFVPYGEFLTAVHETADALARTLATVPQGRVGLSIVGGEGGLLKSGVWVMFLMMRHLETANPPAFARLAGATACPEGRVPSGLAALLHVDDALYSGEQMINTMLRDDACGAKAHATLIAVPYASTFAAASLRRVARHASFTIVRSPEAIPSAFDAPGLTVSRFLRAVPGGFDRIEPFSCTTIFEHKVADSLSLPSLFGSGVRRGTKVQWRKPADVAAGRRKYAPNGTLRTKDIGGETVLAALPPLFDFKNCRVGHYRAVLKAALNEADKGKNRVTRA